MPIGKFFQRHLHFDRGAGRGADRQRRGGLQEAGWLTATPVAGPRLEWLGTYPTAETLAAQVVMLVIVVAGFGFNMLSARRPTPAKA